MNQSLTISYCNVFEVFSAKITQRFSQDINVDTTNPHISYHFTLTKVNKEDETIKEEFQRTGHSEVLGCFQGKKNSFIRII